MSLFKAKVITVYRPATGSDVKGKWVEGAAPTPFTVQGTVQPMDIRRVPLALTDGRRIIRVVEIISDQPLLPADPRTQTTGDLVSWDGGPKFEVLSAETWNNGILPHHTAVAILEKEFA
jgi:hypothetical protein